MGDFNFSSSSSGMMRLERAIVLGSSLPDAAVLIDPGRLNMTALRFRRRIEGGRDEVIGAVGTSCQM